MFLKRFDPKKLDPNSLASVIYHSLVDDASLWVARSIINNPGELPRTGILNKRSGMFVSGTKLFEVKTYYHPRIKLGGEIKLTSLEKRAIKAGLRDRSNKLSQLEAKKIEDKKNEVKYRLMRAHEL